MGGVDADSLFAKADANGDGFIDSNELLLYLLGSGAEPDLVSDLFAQIDTNKDGKISKDEWRAAYDVGCLGGSMPLTAKLMARIFDAVDTTGNGAVSRTEAHGLTTLLSRQAEDDSQRKSVEAFVAALDDGLFRGGLVQRVTKAEWTAFRPSGGGGGPDTFAPFARLAAEAVREPDLLRASLDELHVESAGGGPVRSEALDAAAGGRADKLRSRFNALDADGSGYLSREEIEEMHLTLSDAQIDDLMKQADVDADGKVSFDEFCKALDAFDRAEAAENDALALPE